MSISTSTVSTFVKAESGATSSADWTSLALDGPDSASSGLSGLREKSSSSEREKSSSSEFVGSISSSMKTTFEGALPPVPCCFSSRFFPLESSVVCLLES